MSQNKNYSKIQSEIASKKENEKVWSLEVVAIGMV
jgi:hypothetical protein